MQRFTVPNELSSNVKKMNRLFASEQMDIINIQMRAGEAIPTHNAKQTAVVIVRKGELIFNVEGTDYELKDTDILVLKPLENHSLLAITDVEVVVLKIHK